MKKIIYTKAVKIANTFYFRTDRDIFKKMDFRRLSYLKTLSNKKYFLKWGFKRKIIHLSWIIFVNRNLESRGLSKEGTKRERLAKNVKFIKTKLIIAQVITQVR